MIPRLDCQAELTDEKKLAEALAGSGLGSNASMAKARLFARAVATLPGVHAAPPVAFFVPGRIEVLGKHTDYAGGSSLVAAAEQGFCLVAAPRDDRTVTVASAASGETIRFLLDGDLVPAPGHWANYPMTVARRVAQNFGDPLQGADVAFASDLPPAAGMSSSSAMIVAFFLAFDAVNRLSARPSYRENIDTATDLAGYLATIENGCSFGTLPGVSGVGTFGGSEDHTAILCARPGHVSRYAYCPVRFERAIRLPDGYVFAVASSGVVAEKTGAAMDRYNAASHDAAALAELWRQETGRTDPHLAAVLSSGPNARDLLTRIVESTAPASDRNRLLTRFAHFVAENEEILPSAAVALGAGDLDSFGHLVDRSQRAAEQLLGNQVPETIHLATSARQAGAAAASAFGAGFGGSVWALVETARAEEFLAAWSRAYEQRFPERAKTAAFSLTAAGPAAFEVVLRP